MTQRPLVQRALLSGGHSARCTFRPSSRSRLSSPTRNNRRTAEDHPELLVVVAVLPGRRSTDRARRRRSRPARRRPTERPRRPRSGTAPALRGRRARHGEQATARSSRRTVRPSALSGTGSSRRTSTARASSTSARPSSPSQSSTAIADSGVGDGAHGGDPRARARAGPDADLAQRRCATTPPSGSTSGSGTSTTRRDRGREDASGADVGSGAWSPRPAAAVRQDVSHALPHPAVRHGCDRAAAPRRRRAVSPGRGDRRRLRDGLGRAGASLGASVRADRRGEAVPRRRRRRHRHVGQQLLVARGRPALVAHR